jgi:hypothetical protein
LDVEIIASVVGRTTEASDAIAKAADVRDAAIAKAKELGYRG